MARKARRTTKTARSPIGTLDRAVDAAMELARTQGWRDTTLADIASTSGIGLGALRREVGGKTEILLALVRRADAAMLDAGAAEGETTRDRVFELLMRRLDALAPHKSGLKAVARDLPRDPASLLLLGCATARAMSWLLEAAGADPHGPLGRLKVKALGAIYLATLRTWFADEGADHGKTMAFLDKALKRVEGFAAPFGRRAQKTEA
jgi:AcrR family transcriptional regulator